MFKTSSNKKEASCTFVFFLIFLNFFVETNGRIWIRDYQFIFGPAKYTLIFMSHLPNELSE